MTRQTIPVPQTIRVDRLVKAVYGSEGGGTVAALLDANPGLAALIGADAMIPAGTALVAPDVVVTKATPVTRPWD